MEIVLESTGLRISPHQNELDDLEPRQSRLLFPKQYLEQTGGRYYGQERQ